MGDNTVSSKRYQGGKLVAESKEQCGDFDTAFVQLEFKMQELKGEYTLEKDERDGPEGIRGLGKRSRSSSPKEVKKSAAG
jgi:hypothetical protein